MEGNQEIKKREISVDFPASGEIDYARSLWIV
jgi:hypothetical protein